MRFQSTIRGACMRSFGWHGGDVAVIDTEAPIYSGDVVRLQVPQGWILKILRCDHDGRWFLQCSDGIAPLSPWSVVPLCEPQKVIEHKQGRPMAGYDEPVPGATERDKAIFEALTGPGLAWKDGVPWPGVEAALDAFPWPAEFQERFDLAMATHAALPTVNPTTPGRPNGLTVEQTHVAGTLLFTIDEPNVIPIGTRYRIYRSTVSSGPPASGTLVYDGANIKADIYADRGRVGGRGSCAWR